MPDENVPDGTTDEAPKTTDYAVIPVYELTGEHANAIKDGTAKWQHLRDTVPIKHILMPVADLPSDHIQG